MFFFFMGGGVRQDSRWSDREGFEQGIAEQGKLIAAKWMFRFNKP